MEQVRASFPKRGELRPDHLAKTGRKHASDFVVTVVVGFAFRDRLGNRVISLCCVHIFSFRFAANASFRSFAYCLAHPRIGVYGTKEVVVCLVKYRFKFFYAGIATASLIPNNSRVPRIPSRNASKLFAMRA